MHILHRALQHFLETLLTKTTFNTFALLYAALCFADNPHILSMFAAHYLKNTGKFGHSFKTHMEPHLDVPWIV